jgi:hypothetical protein
MDLVVKAEEETGCDVEKEPQPQQRGHWQR